jgi:tetratricopeptide (TPR) repeat protein
MSSSLFHELLEKYQAQLGSLEQADTSTGERFLSILFTRDAVEKSFVEQASTSPEQFTTLIQLDNRLKQYVEKMPEVALSLPEWRKSRKPPKAAWWWHFKPNTVMYALQDYKAALSSLGNTLAFDTSSLDAIAENLLACLLARDALENEISSGDRPASLENISVASIKQVTDRKTHIEELDKQFKHQIKCIKLSQKKYVAKQLNRWRNYYQPAAESWWWFVLSYRWWFFNLYSWLKQFDWIDSLDEVWNVASIIFLTISIALVVDISTRYLAGGPELRGAFQVSWQSIITLIAGGSALTQPGREFLQRTLTRLRIPKGLWHELSVGLLFIVLGVLFSYHYRLPQIAEGYVERGNSNYESGHLAVAKTEFERSLKLDPNQFEANFRLGLIYENLNEIEQAREEYLIAVQGKHVSAYNNLARLYILEDRPEQAVEISEKGLDEWEEIQSEESISQQQERDRAEQKYSLLKNLGWARLKQERYFDAEKSLLDAIEVSRGQLHNPDRPTAKPPAAHCLLSQVLENLLAQKLREKNNDNDNEEVKDLRARLETELQDCKRFRDERPLPEEDEWKYRAGKTLERLNRNSIAE